MTSELIQKELTPRNQYINQSIPSNILDILDILEDSSLKRGNHSLYLAGDILNYFKTYAQSIPNRKFYTLIEYALVEYVHNHPAEEFVSPIQITLHGKLQGIKGRLRCKILMGEIGGVLNIVERLEETGGGDLPHFRRKLTQLVGEAIKLKELPREMIDLLERAERHI